MSNLDTQLEAVLFWKGEAITVKKLAEIFAVSEEEIKKELAVLDEKLKERGIRLIQHEEYVTLGTAASAAALIEKLTKEELAKDLGKAGLETLSIILYRGPVSRRDIDYIRGVNSNFIIRNLLVRGLIEKVPSPNDQRSFLYKPTLELLSYLGVQNISELPEYLRVRSEIDQFKAGAPEETKQQDQEASPLTQEKPAEKPEN